MPSAQAHQAAFLAAAVRAFLNPAEVFTLADLARSFAHWEGLVAGANWHLVSPVLWQALEALPAGLVPDAVLREVRAANEKNSFRNLFLLGELRRVSELFEKNNIPMVAFKGPVLALTCYGDTGLRRFEDLDILVPPGQAWRARDLLRAEGYRQDSNVDWCGEAVYFRSTPAVVMIRGDATIDLHWRMFSEDFPFRLDSTHLWLRRGTIMIAGCPVPILSAEHQLLAIAAHGAKHYWSRLGWLCDLGRFLQTVPLDWPRVFALAEPAGSPLVLAHALALARDFAGVLMPPEVQQWMSAGGRLERRARRVACVAANRILSARGKPKLIESVLFVLPFSSRPADVLRMAHSYVLEPRVADWEILRLSPNLYPFYYPFRLVRLAAKYTVGRIIPRRRTVRD